MVMDNGPSLLEAAPYIERFRGQFVVVKLGGELFDRGGVIERLVPQLGVLFRCGLRPLVVHGGGKQIDARCAERKIPIEKRGGRRLTSKDVLSVVLELVAGELNQTLCAQLSSLDVPVRGFADGLSRAVVCTRRPPVEVDGELVDFGEVGDIAWVETSRLLASENGERDPLAVLPSIGTLEDGSPVNVNADSVAARVATSMRAQKLVMLTAVPGVMEHPNADGPISQLTVSEAKRLLASPSVTDGMRAKLEEAITALSGGVRQVHIISGIAPQTLLREIFTADGCGTLIVAD